MAERKCPICGAAVGAKDVNEAFPFCSERCRLIDLGQWLGEKYRVPGDTVQGGDEEPEGGEGTRKK